MNGKQKYKYWIITIFLLFFIIVPIITVFGEAAIVDGRLNFTKPMHIIGDKGNLKTIKTKFLILKI